MHDQKTIQHYINTIAKALNTAKHTGTILGICTCNSNYLNWRGDKCGHCQILEAQAALKQIEQKRKDTS